MTTSRFFSLNSNFVLEYIYESDVINTADKGFNILKNGYDGRNYMNSNDSFFPINVNILDKQYTTLDRSTGRHVYLNQDLVESYNDYDPKLTDTLDMPVDFTTHYDITYDTLRIHFRSGYDMSDTEGIYLNVQYKTMGSFEVNVSNLIYLKTDSYKTFYPNSKLIGDILYNSYIDIKVPSLNFLKIEQKNYPSNTDKLYSKITDTFGLDLTSNVIIDFGNIKRNYKEVINIAPTITQEYTFFELQSEHLFTIAPVDEYADFFASIIEENPEVGDYFILQAKASNGSISDYISYLNQEVNTDWFLMHDIIVYEQIGYTHVQTNEQHYSQDDNFDEPILYRPIIKNGNSAISYVIQYSVRLVNKFNNDQILKNAQYISTQPQKYGRKLSRLNIGTVPTVDKIYNKIQVNEIKYDYSVSNKNKSIQEKYVINYYENNDICVINSDVSASNISLSGTNIKRQGECMIEIDDIDTFIKFNVYDSNSGGVSNKNMNGVGDLYLTFIDNAGQAIKIPQIYDNQFDSTKGEIAFKIPAFYTKQITTFTNPKFYILSESQGQDSNIYDGVWVSGKDYSSNIFTGLNKQQADLIKNLNQQLDALKLQMSNKDIEIANQNKRIDDLNTTIATGTVKTNNIVFGTGNIVKLPTNVFQVSTNLKPTNVVSLKSTNIASVFNGVNLITPP